MGGRYYYKRIQKQWVMNNTSEIRQISFGTSTEGCTGIKPCWLSCTEKVLNAITREYKYCKVSLSGDVSTKDCTDLPAHF